MRALRRQLLNLPQGKIYLHAPQEMKVGDKRIVDARVGVNVPDKILQGQTHSGDQTRKGTLRVSHEMIATLLGPGFAITHITPEKQTVAEGFPTVWEWEIEAKQKGSQELQAILYALVSDGASGTAQQYIDSYDQKINVIVKPQTWVEWLKSASANVDTINATIIALGSISAAVAGWFGIFRRQRKKRASSTPYTSKHAAKSGGKGGKRAA